MSSAIKSKDRSPLIDPATIKPFPMDLLPPGEFGTLRDQQAQGRAAARQAPRILSHYVDNAGMQCWEMQTDSTNPYNRAGRTRGRPSQAAKAASKAKAKPKVHFRLKFQNRNGVEMPSIFDNEESKQILQLSTKVDPDATDKVREWVRKFFTTKKQTLQLSCMNAMKSRQGPDPVRAAKLAAIRNESDVATPCFLSVGRLRFLPLPRLGAPPCSAGPAWPDPSCCPALCPLPCALCPLPPLPSAPSAL